MAQSQIITGQYVTISQTPASVGERFVAQFIDIILLTIYSTGATFLISYINNEYNLWNSSISTYAYWVFILLPDIMYQLMCEILLQGQSVGKKIMKIRVTMLDGSTPTLSAYLMRWIFYPVEVLMLPGISVLFVVFTRNNQRLGDLAAGTIITKEVDASRFRYLLNDQPFVANGYKPTYPEAADLTLKQVELISRTFYSTQPNRDELVARLANKIQQHLGIDPQGMDAATFISVVSNDYHYYASTIEV